MTDATRMPCPPDANVDVDVDVDIDVDVDVDVDVATNKLATNGESDRSLVLRASRALADETDVDLLAQCVLQTALCLCDANSACLLVHDTDRGWLRVAWTDGVEARLTPDHRLDGDVGGDAETPVLHRATECCHPEIIEDFQREPRPSDAGFPIHEPPRSVLVMPIVATSGRTRAVLVLWRALSTGPFTQRHVDRLELMAGQYCGSIDHAVAVRELRRRACETTRERRHATLELQLRHRALDALTQGVMIVDQRDVAAPEVCYVNRQFTHDFGYTLADLQREGPDVLYGSNNEQPGLAVLQRAVHSATAGRALVQARRKSGEDFWCETSVASLQPGVRVSIYDDVTPRVEAERLRRLSDERLRSVFEHSPDGFVVLDADRRVCQVNPAFEALTGLSQAALAGSSDEMLERRLATMCLPRRADQPEDVLHLASKPPITLWRRRPRAVDSDGRETVLFFRDITHDIESDRLKNEFLATAAHELRTPLTSVFGFAELLLDRPRMAVAEREELIAIVHRQSGALRRLIDEVLELSRLEAGGHDCLDLQLQPMQPLVMQAAQQACASPGLERIDVRLPLEHVWMRLDSQKMVRALAHALSNGLRFGGDGPVVVSLEQPPGSRRLGIRVKDSGRGMSAAQVSRLFDRFFRADRFEPSRGTGLGATMMKAIVELHGGQVTATSEPGVGTEITFWLDRPQAVEPGQAQRGSPTALA